MEEHSVRNVVKIRTWVHRENVWCWNTRIIKYCYEKN